MHTMGKPTTPETAPMIRFTLDLTESEILLLDSALTKLIEVKNAHRLSAPGGPNSIMAVNARMQAANLWQIREQVRKVRKERH